MCNVILGFCCLQTCFLLHGGLLLNGCQAQASYSVRVFAPLKAIQDDLLQRAVALVLHDCALLSCETSTAALST